MARFGELQRCARVPLTLCIMQKRGHAASIATCIDDETDVIAAKRNQCKKGPHRRISTQNLDRVCIRPTNFLRTGAFVPGRSLQTRLLLPFLPSESRLVSATSDHSRHSHRQAQCINQCIQVAEDTHTVHGGVSFELTTTTSGALLSYDYVHMKPMHDTQSLTALSTFHILVQLPFIV
jgi:hypothetical protein